MDFSRLSRNPSIFSRLMVEYKKDFAGWGEKAPALSLAALFAGPRGSGSRRGASAAKGRLSGRRRRPTDSGPGWAEGGIRIEKNQAIC